MEHILGKQMQEKKIKTSKCGNIVNQSDFSILESKENFFKED